MSAQVTLVLGGVASGKSTHAETLVRATGAPLHYIATAEAQDDEMRARIERHRAARGPGWTTVEAPRDLAQALGEVPEGHAVLVDCATLWLSNHLLADHDLAREQAALLAALESCAAAAVVIVSNEVGLSGVAPNALARRFADAQGQLNQALAVHADHVILVAAGLPVILKDART